MTNPNGNLFGGQSSPSVKFPTVGTEVTIDVTEWPEAKQSKNFETGQPESWPDGRPKQIVLVAGKVNGEDHALWVTPGTALAAAIRTAEQESGKDIGPGSKLTVKYTHDVPSSKGAHFHPAKQYSAHHAPASVFASAPAATPAPAAPAAAPAPAAPVAEGLKPLSPEQYAALSAAGVDMTPFVVAVGA